MDIWGVGCVFFEMLSLFPLFPGNNEKDQVHKIHNILGTPSKELLERFQKYASHMEVSFTPTVGTGLTQLFPPNTSTETISLITQLLTYNPDERITTKHALNSPCFKEFRAVEAKAIIYKEPSGATPTSTNEEHSIDSQDPKDYPNSRRVTKPIEDQIKKKLQQGNKKGWEHDPEGINDYEDGNPNNVPTISSQISSPQLSTSGLHQKGRRRNLDTMLKSSRF